MTRAQGDRADVIYVLCLLEVGFLLLAALGEVLLMGGNPAYLAVPLAKSALLVLLAATALRNRRWALIALLVLHVLTLVGFWLQLAAAMLPFVTATVNLVGLLTNLALPVIVITLAARLLAAGRTVPGVVR
ncbi:MAG TPA: hypothetical protein VF163_03320 [Micromonosporaceae bacterium]